MRIKTTKQNVLLYKRSIFCVIRTVQNILSRFIDTVYWEELHAVAALQRQGVLGQMTWLSERVSSRRIQSV